MGTRSHSPASFALLVALGAIPVGVACSSSSSSDGPGSTTPDAGGTDGGSDAVVEGPKTPLTVWAFDRIAFDDPTKPVVDGAIVAFDPPGGGERVEKPVEADGHVTFEADFSKGGGTVTFFHKDFIALSLLGISPDVVKKLPKNTLGKPDDNLVIIAQRTQGAFEKSLARLQGAITNKAQSANVVALGVNVPGMLYENAAPTYQLRVQKDKPFFVLGSEIVVSQPDARSFDTTLVKHFKIDRPALSQDATFDVDLATVATLPDPTVRKWKIELPGGDAGPLGTSSRALCHGLSTTTALFPGAMKKIGPSADKSAFECELYVSPVTAPKDVVSRAVVLTQDGAASVRFEPGIAPDGTVFKDMMVPPAIVVDKVKRTDPMPLDGVDKTGGVQLRLANGPDVVWVVAMPPGSSTTQLTIPAAPTGMTVPATQTAGIAVLSTQTVTLESGDVQPKGIAISRTFSVTK